MNATIIEPITMAKETMISLTPSSVGPKLKTILSIMPNVSPVIMPTAPSTPVTPNPGIANTSTATSINPATKITTGQFDASPSRYIGAKYNVAATSEASRGNPTPGVCSSK